MRDGRTGLEASGRGRLWVCTGQGNFIPFLTIGQHVVVPAERSARIKANAGQGRKKSRQRPWGFPFGAVTRVSMGVVGRGELGTVFLSEVPAVGSGRAGFCAVRTGAVVQGRLFLSSTTVEHT